MRGLFVCVYLLVLGAEPGTQPATQPAEVDRLIADLKSEVAAERLAAAVHLGRIVRLKDPGVLAALNAALQVEVQQPVRFEMIRALVKLGDTEARDLLRTYCLSPYWNVGLAAAGDLRDAGDTQYLKVMVHLGLASTDPEVRDSVLQALRLLKAPETVGPLREAVRGEPGIGEAGHLLAYLEGAEARGLLLEALGRRATAYGAARGLVVIAEPGLLAELRTRLYRPESAAGAAHALGLIGGPQACATLFEAVDYRQDDTVAAQAVLAILGQSFGYGVPGAEHRWSLVKWQQWWGKNRGAVGGFENVTVPAGLLAVHGIGHRVSWGDFDGDGYDDLLVSGRHLFRNDRGRGFIDVTERAGIYREDVVAGVWADYNNDGRLDFYAPCSAPGGRDRLWRNQGDGIFLDVTADAGQVSDPQESESAAWADFDRDGHVDLYVANSRAESAGRDAPAAHDRLYRNKGDGTFADASRSSGIAAGTPRASRGVAWADFDNDADLDCYVANYLFEPNRLWLNRGDGTFEDVAAAQRVSGRAHQFEGEDDEPEVPQEESALQGRELFGRSLGCAWADYNNDGYLDLFCANIAPRDMLLYCDQSQLFRNRGRAAGALLGFRDVRGGVGITYEHTHAECAWGDYDNDGDLDLVITSTFWKRRSYFYRNNGDGTFEDVTWATGTRVLNGWGCAFSDYDGDGRLDLAVAGYYGVRLFRNVTQNANKWLQVELVGTRSNRSAIGARVTVVAGGLKQIREVSGGRGTGCQDSLVQHFGLGPRPTRPTVTVRWPDGNVQVLDDVQPNQRIRIVEKS